MIFIDFHGIPKIVSILDCPREHQCNCVLVSRDKIKKNADVVQISTCCSTFLFRTQFPSYVKFSRDTY